MSPTLLNYYKQTIFEISPLPTTNMADIVLGDTTLSEINLLRQTSEETVVEQNIHLVVNSTTPFFLAWHTILSVPLQQPR